MLIFKYSFLSIKTKINIQINKNIIKIILIRKQYKNQIIQILIIKIIIIFYF